ncbi:putative galacturonosyltransferase 4 [Hibiscus syriacus]|uniref:Hexosyltransferase n=1 Tax=Hibiscus syriacus TaxID=106335 RepID=A0A6A3BE11_HIBSY|nr:putative galacturonosyltransferase 4 [Hibiscus syriacus]
MKVLSGDNTRHLNVLQHQEISSLKEPIGVVYSDRSTDSFPKVTTEHKSTRVLSATDEGRQQQLSNPIRQFSPTINRSVVESSPIAIAAFYLEFPISAVKLEQQPIQPAQKIDQTERSDNKHDRQTEPADVQVCRLKDQLICAKVYLSLPSIKNNPHVTRELRLRVKEVTRSLGDATKDTDLPKNAVDKMKAMDQSLEKAKQVQDDCTAVVKKLRGMLHSSEEQLRVHKKQTMFLTQLTAKTLPKALHCLPLRLTTEYYSLNSSQQNFPNQQKLEDPRLYHYALFSDNIMAAAVVVNSTVVHAKHPSNHVFHIITDRLNYAAMRMWFLGNQPGKATIQVQNIEEFTWLNASYSPVLKQLDSPSMIDYYFRAHRANSDQNLKFRNPKYLSILNHLRFYLPEIFPKLNKVLFLDDDIVVRKDLTGLWSLDLKGNVNGAVETCGESFHRFDRYLNFSNPLISKNFDPHACGWAYGMNIFYLDGGGKTSRRYIIDGRGCLALLAYAPWVPKPHNHTHYRTQSQLAIVEAGDPTSRSHNILETHNSLDKSWHVLGLGYNPNVNQREIEEAAVIHYNGNLKPWLEIALPKYKNHWTKYVDYNVVYLRECNINP